MKTAYKTPTVTLMDMLFRQTLCASDTISSNIDIHSKGAKADQTSAF